MTWNEEYWPLIIQLYEKKPAGIKPMYSRDTVNLALELHIHPKVLYQKMYELRQPSRPSLQRLCQSLSGHPGRLKKVCQQIRSLAGMGNASEFYDGVDVCDTFEQDFKPVNAPTAQLMNRPLYSPVMLIMILDLYFRLVPQTMVPETPEVREVANLISVSPQDVTDILEIFMFCDPFMKHDECLMDPMLPPCARVWKRFCHDEESNIEELSNLAQQLKAYWQ